MAYRILLRRDSSEKWGISNPVLLLGEPGYSTDTHELKIGDGLTEWNQLPIYIGGPTGATGPTGAGGTGANTFYGSQTITGTTGTLILSNYSTFNFPDDPTAATAGIPLGGMYHNSGAVRIRLT
jgi:hypothetical protein